MTAVAPRFDAVIHPPPRLQVCGLLAAVDTMDFAAVRDTVGVSDSVLSKHVEQLEEAGYVRVHKATRASRLRTGLALTTAGRAAFDAHVAELRRITGGWRTSASPPGREGRVGRGARAADLALVVVAAVALTLALDVLDLPSPSLLGGLLAGLARGLGGRAGRPPRGRPRRRPRGWWVSRSARWSTEPRSRRSAATGCPSCWSPSAPCC